ncbi:phage head morphogenesis protein [Turicibacter sanguinis]|nr:phage head morphogenesis protein [Turicibacter sanguinis]MTN85270.1 phage head morphogenesis protein [Turicibacter sanguinis]MTN88091.1 phage head morphogenesis protein [Turicibacter sanguinis]MTN90945.1 phage head morphogenesis protein [Turicibacter sanguinis]MTN93774.1 phage head morphogenesis protein [Turicibacter sanguinis]
MAKSDTYWSNRSNKRMETYHKDSNRVILKIAKAYEEAIKEINQNIERMLDNFMIGNALTKLEAKKFLNQKIKNEVINQYKKILPTIEDEKLKQKIIAHIESQAYGARITRLEALKQNIYLNLATVADVELRESEKLYIRTMNKAYYLNCYDIQKGIGIGFNIAAMPTDVIEEILKTNWSGMHYSDRVWRNSQVMAKKLEQVLLKGVMTGKSYRKLAIELEEMSEDGVFAAERLIRTEMTYISNQAELQSYKECGIEEYIFVATLDSRTSKPCRKMDRKRIKISDAVVGENLPPLHPWCRSTTRMGIDDGVLATMRRRARDPQTRKTYLVPANMSYSEWKAQFTNESN